MLCCVAIGGLLLATGLIAYFWQPAAPPRTVVMSTAAVDRADRAAAMQ